MPCHLDAPFCSGSEGEEGGRRAAAAAGGGFTLLFYSLCNDGADAICLPASALTPDREEGGKGRLALHMTKLPAAVVAQRRKKRTF